MRSIDRLLLGAALAVLPAVVAAQDAPPATGAAPAPAAAPAGPGCACHDALGAPSGAPRVDLRGWAVAGPHKEQGCVACHPGADSVPHHPDRLRSVDCASCHADQAKGWAETVHGRVKGNPDLRGCLTCHAEHAALKPDDPRARYAPTGLLNSCATCHEPRPMRIDGAFPVKPAEPGQARPSSVHGLISDGERVSVANCASCHGEHGIFPSSDPRSAIHPQNLAATCGRCHTSFDVTVIQAGFHGPISGAKRAAMDYFDEWYLWASGTAVLSVLGVAGSLVAAAVLRRRERRQRT